ncbi:MAG: TIGR00725 family protein [Oligoflexia bacterium]|nr:TIGR00725 family protein [Oligoflexia bacterium]
MTTRRPIAAVIGSQRAEPLAEAEAEALGQALVQAGFRIVTGGLGGIMRAASRGARSAASYRSGDIIGVLPGYDAAQANEFVDIPICTGLNHGRNLVVVATADVVLAVGGRSGTLSEIALAWAVGRPVIAVGTTAGWAGRLAGEQLDDRREDRIEGPLPPEDAALRARALLADHPYRFGPIP